MTPHRPLVLSALLAALAGPALAAGLGDTAPDFVDPGPPPEAATYAPENDWTGFYGGVQLGYGRIDDRTEPGVFDDDFAGATYGAHVGYLYDLGSVVAGAELDLEGTNLEDDATGLKVDGLARAKLRLGFDAGRVLPYLTGGVVQATTSGFADLEDTGGFAGFGVDYQATDRMRVGAEVLRHRFEDFDDTDIDFDATTVSARVSLNF